MAVDIPPAELLFTPSDEQLAMNVWQWWVARQVERLGYSLDTVSQAILEEIRLRALVIDTNRPESFGWEKFLRLAASGQFARAGRILRDDQDTKREQLAAVHTAQTVTRQRVLASKQSRSDPLQELIVELVAADELIDGNTLLHSLKAKKGSGIIVAIDSEKITFKRDLKEEDTARLSGLKDRLSRAKRAVKLKKDSR